MKDYCKFFQTIEENPQEEVEVTVREMIEAEEHLRGCDACFNRSERILAKAPKEQSPLFGEN